MNNLRHNQFIRNVYTVNLIDQNGQHIGKLSFREALSLAKATGLDLVEVNQNSNPPTCKIMDFGKYKFRQNKQKRVAKKQAIEDGTYKPHQGSAKEIALTVKMSKHDLGTKANQIQELINEGCKILIKLRFIRREIQHPHLGVEQMNNLLGFLTPETYVVDSKPTLNGKIMTMQISMNKTYMMKPKKELST